jgi:hydrophobic/amphiphilic exporter-1 (mainly G- bacteria), HAE1 family
LKLPQFAVKNPVTTLMMMLLVGIFGFVSLTGLKMDLMPNINPPVVAVMTTYPGAGPEEVTEMVTKPIEDVISTTQGLKTMESRSSDNASLVIAQYDWGTDVSEIREDIATRLGTLQLPDDVGQPMIVKFDPTMMPIMQFTVSNGDDLAHLQQVVNEEIVPALQNIKGVANVSISGGFSEEIIVKLDETQLKKYQLSQSDVVQMIQANNLTYPGGVIENQDEKLSLRIIGKTDSIEALQLLPISIEQTREGINIVSLKDVATIEKVKKEAASLARQNGKESLLISIQKEGSANTQEVSEAVRDKLSSFEKEYRDMTFTISSDQGEIIEKSVSNVTKALLYGGLFAIIVIFIFLRSASSTFIVGLSIPFSVVVAFILMYFANITLNIMSLGGLALGVGMLVDNSIVVIENIYRHLSLGKHRREAAIEGTKEVAGAVTASMLTTIAVFLPVVFVGGFVGDLFKELALTVTFSLLASWIVALTVVPTLAALLLNPNKVKKQKHLHAYRRILAWTLKHRFITLLVAFSILIGSLALAPKVGTEFLPTQDEGIFTVEVTLPEGATMERTLAVVEEIEKEANTFEDIETITATIGTGDQLQASYSGVGENSATVTFKLVDREERKKNTETVMNELKEKIENKDLEGSFNYNLSNSMQAISGEANVIDILIVGKDRETVKQYTNELKTRLKEVDSITTVTDSIEIGKPEFHFVIDKEKAFQYGFTTAQVASFVNKLVQGEVATKLSENGVEIDVRVITDQRAQSKEALENTTILSPTGIEVKLKEIGDIQRTEGPVTIVRENQQDVVTVKARFSGKTMGTISSDIQKTIQEMKQDLNIDEDVYNIKLAGGAEMMEESFADLSIAMLLAVVFVYMVMASQFESLLHPFTIMFTLPLSITGVILGLLITGYSFGITAFIGIIILVGIVVNNGIVFVDYTNQLREKGLSVYDALIEAGATRLRPILMTALTTILGLFPLAIGTGEGAEIQAPMGVAVIGGLCTSTLLTLIVIPVVYSIIESIKGMRRKRKTEEIVA